jgi:FkbM family methyltransferase
MHVLASLKQASISAGLYKPARALHRMLRPTERRAFRDHRKLLSQFIGPGDLAFDVGANIGVRTEIMLSLGARVVAFEPQPICAREVIARGNMHLTVVEKAVGASEGTATLHLKRANVQASIMPEWQGGPSIGSLIVPVTTLNHEINKFGIPEFCKIDVEGFEPEVMAGLSTPIPKLSFEYHCDENGVSKLKAIFTHLARLGRYEANLIGQEDNSWLLSRWLPNDYFVAAFPACAAPNFWGDVFVRLA